MEAAAGSEKGASPRNPADAAAAAAAFGEEQEALVLSAWNAMKGDSASLALKFFLRYHHLAAADLSPPCDLPLLLPNRSDIMLGSLSLEMRLKNIAHLKKEIGEN